MNSETTLHTLSILADAYCDFIEAKMQASNITKKTFAPLEGASQFPADFSLLEWTVSVKCEGIPEISEIWFSMDSAIAEKFLGVLGLSTSGINREMYIEASKELMNLIIGHATRHIPELLQTQLSAIYLYISQHSLEEKTLFMEDIHADTGRMCILLIQDTKQGK